MCVTHCALAAHCYRQVLHVLIMFTGAGANWLLDYKLQYYCCGEGLVFAFCIAYHCCVYCCLVGIRLRQLH